jgi:hypothetical protein
MQKAPNGCFFLTFFAVDKGYPLWTVDIVDKVDKSSNMCIRSYL